MSIAFVNLTGAIETSGASNISVNNPGSTGNYLLVILSADAGAGPPPTPTLPDASWHVLDSVNYGSDGSDTYIIYSTSSDGAASYNFSNLSSFAKSIIAYAFTGVDNTVVPIFNKTVDSTGGDTNPTPINITAPSINTTVDNCELIWMIGLDDGNSVNNTFTFPAGYLNTSQQPPTATAQNGASAIAHKNQGTHGATGTVTGTISVSGPTTAVNGWAAYLLALTPSGGGGGGGGSGSSVMNAPPTDSLMFSFNS